MVGQLSASVAGRALLAVAGEGFAEITRAGGQMLFLVGGGSSNGGDTGGNGDLADLAMQAALRYRAQAPIVDNLLRELGLDGASVGLPPAKGQAETD